MYILQMVCLTYALFTSKLQISYAQQHIWYFDRVDQKLSGQNGGYNLSQATAIVGEIRQMQASLTLGEQEKQNLMQVKYKLKITVKPVLRGHFWDKEKLALQDRQATS